MDMDDDACYRALCTRDARFDGRLFVGVKTTGIYCRPICPARTPKRENVRFYPTAAAAQSAGFRPCLRCRPETSPDLAAWRGASNTVARALSLIEAGALDDADVDGLADRLGVGERQLRRLFRKHLGASPIAVAQTRRVLLAKQLIQETRLPMAEVALAAGFGSDPPLQRDLPAALRPPARGSCAGSAAPTRPPATARRCGSACPTSRPTTGTPCIRLPGAARHPRGRAGDRRPLRAHASAIGGGGRRDPRGADAAKSRLNGHRPLPEDQRPAGDHRPGAPRVRPRRRPGGDRRAPRQGPGAGAAASRRGRGCACPAPGTASSWRSAPSSASRSPSSPLAASPPSWWRPTASRCRPSSASEGLTHVFPTPQRLLGADFAGARHAAVPGRGAHRR